MTKEEIVRVNYSEQRMAELLEADDLNTEDKVAFNILNFIRTIQLNQQDFIEAQLDSEFYGELPMTFKKKPGQVMGLVTATIDGTVEKYVFNDKGYVSLEELMDLS